MAQIEAKMPMIGKRSKEGAYSDAVAVGKLINITVTPNNNSVDLYADDSIAESVHSADTLNISMGTSTVPVGAVGMMFGAAVTDETSSDGITAKKVSYSGKEGDYVGFGYIKTEMADNKKTHIVHFLPKVKWQRPASTSTTRGNTVTFGTPTITGTAYRDDVLEVTDCEYHYSGEGSAKCAVDKLNELLGKVSS